MLCFNYIANIIKFGICWDDGHVGICGICGMRITCRGMRDCGDMRDMRDGPPPRNRPGRAAVFGPAPPNPQRTGNKNGKRSASRKRNAYFAFNLLIINNINQYFNTHLHLIRFITYNRRIFIAKYLFDNKTCSIFALVR